MPSALNKEDVLTRTRLGQVRLAMGDADRAMKDLESASALDATGFQPDLALIAAHLRRKEFDKALEAANTLEKKQPKNPLTFNVKGVVYGAKGDYKNARTSFEKALELQFDYLPAAQNLARLDIAEKKPEAALGRFEAILAKQPKNEQALIGLAGVQVATGAPPKDVLATLDRAVAANPASVAAKVALAEYHLRTGDAKAALAVLQGAAATSPNDPRILEMLGLAQQRMGENNQAIETYKKLADAATQGARAVGEACRSASLLPRIMARRSRLWRRRWRSIRARSTCASRSRTSRSPPAGATKRSPRRVRSRRRRPRTPPASRSRATPTSRRRIGSGRPAPIAKR